MLVQLIADYFNLSTWSIRVMMSILLGYPLSFIYQSAFNKKPMLIQHIFILSTGVLLFLFNFGFDIYHSALNILFVFALINMVGVNKYIVAFVFLQQTAYLLGGCIFVHSGLYTVDWTTPQCVLCLRLIGLMWDLYDGTREEKELSPSQKKSALKQKPTLIEMLSYCYFFGGFLCGPQFSLRHFLECLEGRHIDENLKDKIISSRIWRTWKCFVQGIVCLATYLFTQNYFYEEAFVQEWFFKDLSFFGRVLYMTAFGNFVLFRYLAVWKLTEGASVMMGLGYDGFDNEGKPKHDAMANVYLQRFTTGYTCNDMVNSFNTNTNKWMLEYVYKRLRFLNSRTISQISTLSYLALWHGVYSGYFINFFIEFTVLVVEKELSPMSQRSWINHYIKTYPTRLIWKIFAKACMTFAIGQALTAFCLLKFQAWYPVYKSVYFCAFIFLLWHPFKPLIKLMLAPKRPPIKNDAKEEAASPPVDTKKEE